MLAAHFNIQELTVLLLGANTATEAGADDTSATEALLAIQGSMHGMHHKPAAQLFSARNIRAMRLFYLADPVCPASLLQLRRHWVFR